MRGDSGWSSVDVVAARARQATVIENVCAAELQRSFVTLAAGRYEPGTENIIGTLGRGGAISRFLECDTRWAEPGTPARIVIFAKLGVSADDLHARLTAAGVKCAVRTRRYWPLAAPVRGVRGTACQRPFGGVETEEVMSGTRSA